RSLVESLWLAMEKDHKVSTSMMATHGAAAYHSARAQAAQWSRSGRVDKSAMIRCSNANGTRSSGGWARAAAISFLCSSTRFIAYHSQAPRGAAGLQILLFGDSRQNFPHFRPGAEGAHLHQRHRPSGQLRDFLNGTVFDFQECDNQPRRRRKQPEDASHQL